MGVVTPKRVFFACFEHVSKKIFEKTPVTLGPYFLPEFIVIFLSIFVIVMSRKLRKMIFFKITPSRRFGTSGSQLLETPYLPYKTWEKSVNFRESILGLQNSSENIFIVFCLRKQTICLIQNDASFWFFELLFLS